MGEVAGLSVDQIISAVESVMQRLRPRVEVEVTPDTEFEDLGLDSLEIAEVFLELEDVASAELDPRSVQGVETVAELVMLQRL